MMTLKDKLLKVANAIRIQRKAKGLRQIDLAEKSGVAYRHLQDIEAGKVNISLDTLFRIAHNLDVPPDYLLVNIC